VANDFCVTAEPLSVGNYVTGTTVEALIDETPECHNVVQNGPGVWYKVTGNDKRLVASTCNEDGSMATDFDTAISVFRGSCGNLTCVGANDNFCGTQSRAVWLTDEGETYYILVHSFEAGSFSLTLDEWVPDGFNDYCSAAQGPLLPTGVLVTGSTVGSSFDNVGECGGIPNTSPGVWFFVVVSALDKSD
jgi:hypothetical protein